MTAALLQQRSPSASGEEQLYNVPAGTTVYVSAITICNCGPTTTTVRLAFVRGGGDTAVSNYIFYDLEIPAHESIEWGLAQETVLVSGDSIRIYASATLMAFGLFGREVHETNQPSSETVT